MKITYKKLQMKKKSENFCPGMYFNFKKTQSVLLLGFHSWVLSDFMCGCPIFKFVAEIGPHGKVQGTRGHSQYKDTVLPVYELPL